jgi:asparagine synthase (glutamine-hydrolysing)
MCGILGITASGSETEAAIERAIGTLNRRGPDDRGKLAFPGCTLANTRLAIIDLAGGHQPIADSERGTAIVLNGEIYNYRELRRTLEGLGHRFVTESDTEVILKAYAQYGQNCPEHLDGMFAFAIWDDRNQELFLARDRFGEKPLFYARDGDALIFASEIKAILATGRVGAKLDPVSLDNYLALLYVPPWRTIYADIQTLKPGFSALYKNGRLTQNRYWQIRRQPLRISREEAAESIRDMLAQSVRSRLIADVEVGVLLSGGVDSSIVATLAQAASSRQIKTFSAGFEGFIDELPYAAAVAAAAGTDHREEQIRADLLDAFQTAAGYFDEPFADSSNVPTHLISAAARKSVKVVLSGDGGDELFLGYGHYRKHQHLPRLARLARELLSPPLARFKKRAISHFSPRERARLARDPHAVEVDPTDHVDLSAGETPVEKMNLIDLAMGLPGDMLTKVDRSSMMHSLEVRCPFLNPGLAQFAYNLPVEYKLGPAHGKLILERAFAGKLPAEVFTRPKQGFGAPVKDWLAKPEFRGYVEKTLLADGRIGQFLKPEVVRPYVEAFYAGRTSLQYRVWTLLALEAWCRSREQVGLG